MKIVVLAGGTSTERSVSITSGTMVCKALREKNHQAVLVDVFCGIDVKGNLEDVFAEEAYDIDKAAEYMHSFDAGLNEMIASRRRFFGPNVLELCEAADVVFLALHGANGEDGKVQATFDLLPFNGDVGIHDASWRTEYGGDIYLTNGSHGCVNTPYTEAEKVFNAIEIGDPVIVYYSLDDVTGPQPTQKNSL